MTTRNEVVPRERWLEARRALLLEEKAWTRERDRLAAKRRALPWVRVEKDYRFEGEDGPVTLAELFDGRSQLAVYHFMFGPDWQEGCPGCSLLADHVDGARQHFEHNDLTFVAVSRAPLAKLRAYRERMGWRFRWVSSAGSDFNFDHGVSFPEGQAGRTVVYNYAEQPHPGVDELSGTSIFCKDEDGAVYHTYSTYGRGGEVFLGVYSWLDLVPKGRNETVNGDLNDWVRRHDRYEDDGRTRTAGPPCCGS
jgi:predicted dithiol-disulfide oxidoreductase (DUF899 family)